MSDLERPWVERRRSGPPSSCPVCGAATVEVVTAGVITCRSAGLDHFEWRPDAGPVVSVSSERVDEWKCSWCRGHNPAAETRCGWCTIERPQSEVETGADNRRYDNSLTSPHSPPEVEGWSHLLHIPDCPALNRSGDCTCPPVLPGTKLPRADDVVAIVEGPNLDDFKAVIDDQLEQLRLATGADFGGIVRDVKQRLDAAGHRPVLDVWDGHDGRVQSDAPPLTADEVAELAEGTPITVIWSGGNGPHDYVIAVNDDGTRHAWQGDGNERMRFYNPLRFVGQARFHTRVWLREVPPPVPPLEGELMGRDFVETAERRLSPDAAELASLHRPVYGRPPYCWACTTGGRSHERRVDSGRRAPWPCSTASLALDMMDLSPSDIAITEE